MLGVNLSCGLYFLCGVSGNNALRPVASHCHILRLRRNHSATNSSHDHFPRIIDHGNGTCHGSTRPSIDNAKAMELFFVFILILGASSHKYPRAYPSHRYHRVHSSSSADLLPTNSIVFDTTAGNPRRHRTIASIQQKEL
jgi:hypothetical protein